MGKIDYTQTIMQSEVKANVYAGENLDEIENYFQTFCEGDKESEDHTEDLIIKCDELPPGALITVKYPCCPECGIPREDEFEMSNGRMKIIGHSDKCDCGFDWVEWVIHKYS
jgi:hypothetical protein